jgi:hypothetical protein
VTSKDHLAVLLDALDEEAETAAEIARAEITAADLIEVRADPEAIYQALNQVNLRLANNHAVYYRLEALLQGAGWSLARPDDLPPALRGRLDRQVPIYEHNIRKSAKAEEVINGWLAQQERRHSAERYWATRRRTEQTHTRRARRRGRRQG